MALSTSTDNGNQALDAETPPPLSKENRAGSLVVSHFRAALDWMITHPDWEGAIALAISNLGFKGQRQGISFRQAALSLPLEEKRAAIHHMLKSDSIERPRGADAKMLAKLWSETAFKTNANQARLSSKDWYAFRGRLALRVSNKYLEYKNAQNTLYESHAYLAEQTAHACCKERSQRADAAQEGRLALLQAIDKIQTDKAFETYARQWIKRRIQNFVMRERVPVKAPINLISKSLQAISNGGEASLKCLRNGVIWLDSGLPNEFEINGALQEDPENAPDRCATLSDDKELLANALDNLTLKQREVLAMRFGLEGMSGDASLAEVAAATGISRQQVFQREKRAMAVLKQNLHGLRSEWQQSVHFEKSTASD